MNKKKIYKFKINQTSTVTCGLQCILTMYMIWLKLSLRTETS